MKVYVVTYIDSGDTADGKSRCGGVFKTKKEAKDYVKDDIHSYSEMGYEVDYGHMSVPDAQCEWNIEEIETDIKE